MMVTARRLFAGIGFGVLLLAPAAASATTPPTTPPGEIPIAQVGQQYVTSTGATAVACSTGGPEGSVICYGLVDGAVAAAVWNGATFTTYSDPAATATAPVAIPGDLEAAGNFVDQLLSTVQPDLITLCPMIESEPETVQAILRGALAGIDEIEAKAAEFGVPYEDFLDMIIVAYGNRLLREC